MENIISIKGLKKVYRMGQERVYALNGIDLEVKKAKYAVFMALQGLENLPC